MMYNNLDNLPPEYERDFNQLESQLAELFALLEKSEIQINHLREENSQLKAQIQKLQQQSRQVQDRSSQVETIKIPREVITTVTPVDTSGRQNKRKCPICGAMGFSIKEVEDKSKIICYSPRRIYMKKKVCTKCRYEF